MAKENVMGWLGLVKRIGTPPYSHYQTKGKVLQSVNGGGIKATIAPIFAFYKVAWGLAELEGVKISSNAQLL